MSTYDEIFDDGRVSATALFNKQNGVFVTTVGIPFDQSQYDQALYVGRSVLFNFADDVLIGKLIINADGTFSDAFSVEKRSDQKEQVFEKMLNMQAEQKITKVYPLVDQVNLLVKAIQRLGQEHDLLELPEFTALSEMTSYIDQCIATNQAKKEFYSESPDVEYISDEQVEADLAIRMEGGIHEALGSRPITGGSVFGTGR
jgi:hypothetical protein